MADSELQTPALSPQQVNLIRTAGQRLLARGSRDELLTVIRAVGGINAQLSPAMMLSLRARIKGLEQEDVTRALEETRDIVRTWAMRGTIHLLASSDIRWFNSTLGPIFVAKGRRRYRELGLNEEILERGLAEIPAVLASTGPLTRWELMDALEGRGLSIERRSQAPIHLIRYVALQGSICMGPDRANGEATFTTLESLSTGGEHTGSEADLADLARRYLIGYGPAGLHDFSSWSGVGMADARKAWKSLDGDGNLMKVQVSGNEMVLTKAAFGEAGRQGPGGLSVSLLPAFDTYVLGYSNRDFIVSAEHYKDIYHGGQTVPVVLVNGSAAGVWRYHRRGKRMSVDIYPFTPFYRRIRDLVLEEAEDIGRLFQASLTVDIQ